MLPASPAHGADMRSRWLAGAKRLGFAARGMLVAIWRGHRVSLGRGGPTAAASHPALVGTSLSCGCPLMHWEAVKLSPLPSAGAAQRGGHGDAADVRRHEQAAGRRQWHRPRPPGEALGCHPCCVIPCCARVARGTCWRSLGFVLKLLCHPRTARRAHKQQRNSIHCFTRSS